MGLRFRKSISLFKGVKLNLGKKGVSVTLGSKGFHKTISTSGRVTTSVGIPGTGIYYTNTKDISHNHQGKESKTIDPPKAKKNSKSFDDKFSKQECICPNSEKLNNKIKYSHETLNSLQEQMIYKDDVDDISENWNEKKFEQIQHSGYEVNTEDLDLNELILIRKPDIDISAKRKND